MMSLFYKHFGGEDEHFDLGGEGSRAPALTPPLDETLTYVHGGLYIA